MPDNTTRHQSSGIPALLPTADTPRSRRPQTAEAQLPAESQLTADQLQDYKRQFYRDLHANRPSLGAFLEKTGLSLKDASEAYNTGHDLDTRNWAAIMASADPYAAAIEAKRAMYSDPNYRTTNTAHSIKMGHDPSAAPITYGQMVHRVGASYVPTAAEIQAIRSRFPDGAQFEGVDYLRPAGDTSRSTYRRPGEYQPVLNQGGGNFAPAPAPWLMESYLNQGVEMPQEYKNGGRVKLI